MPGLFRLSFPIRPNSLWMFLLSSSFHSVPLSLLMNIYLTPYISSPCGYLYYPFHFVSFVSIIISISSLFSSFSHSIIISTTSCVLRPHLPLCVFVLSPPFRPVFLSISFGNSIMTSIMFLYVYFYYPLNFFLYFYLHL